MADKKALIADIGNNLINNGVRFTHEGSGYFSLDSGSINVGDYYVIFSHAPVDIEVEFDNPNISEYIKNYLLGDKEFDKYASEVNVPYKNFLKSYNKDWTKEEVIEMVNDIVELEDFNILTEKSNDTTKVFRLKDKQDVNYVDIEEDTYSSLAGLLDRLGMYHEDTFYSDEERFYSGQYIGFLKNEKAIDVAGNISAEDYEKYIAQKHNNADKEQEKPKNIKNVNYIDRFTKEDMQDLESVLETFEDGVAVAEKNNWQIASGGYDLEFTVSYKGEPIIDCINHELKPYKEDKVFELMPVYDRIRFCYADTKFNPQDYNIVKMSSACRSNYKKDGVFLDVVVSKNENTCYLGETNLYDNMGNFNNSNDSLLKLGGHSNEEANCYFRLASGNGVVVGFEEFDKENMFGGMRTVKDFLDIEQSLLDSGIEKVTQFCLDGTPLTKENLNAYIEKAHPEVKTYECKLEKYSEKNEIVAIDTKIAKEMKKEGYSDSRVSFAIAYSSPYKEILQDKYLGVTLAQNMKPEVYAADVLKGKYKTQCKSSAR